MKHYAVTDVSQRYRYSVVLVNLPVRTEKRYMLPSKKVDVSSPYHTLWRSENSCNPIQSLQTTIYSIFRVSNMSPNTGLSTMSIQ